MAGIAADSAWRVPGRAAGALTASAAVLLVVPVLRTRRRVVRTADPTSQPRWGGSVAVGLAMIAAAGLGALRHHQAFRSAPPDHVVTFSTAEPALARLTGRVVQRPLTARRGYEPFAPWLFEQERTSFVVEADTIETAAGEARVSGLVRVTVKEAAPAVMEGARVEAFGWMHRPLGPRNPGAFDWRLFCARRGIRVELSCPRAECVRTLERADAAVAWSLSRVRGAVRRGLLDERTATGDESVSLLDAMVLGRRTGMDRRVEQAFLDTGCAHYLAVSGVHVGMLGLAVWWPCRLLGAGRRRAAIVVALAVVAYALIADPRPPILRATVMTCAYCLALLVRRRSSTIGAMSLAALVLLMVEPTALFDVGFQLSFATVAGIVALAAGLARLIAGSWRPRLAAPSVAGGADDPGEAVDLAGLHPRRWYHAVGRGLLTMTCVAVTAWLSSLPIVAGSFGRIAPWGWLDSLLAFPLVFAVMVLGIVKVAAGMLVPILAGPVDVLLSGSSHLLLVVMDVLARAPGTTVRAPSPPWWVCTAYYGTLGSFALRWRGWVSWRAVAIALVTLCGTVAAWWAPKTLLEGVRITQFAVGRGTSTVIEVPDGGTWVYDAGASGSLDAGATVLVPYLRWRGIHRLEGAIVSHPNLDHFGGLPSVLDAASCRAVYVPPQFAALAEPGTPGHALLAELAIRGFDPVPLAAGAPVDLGAGVVAEVLWPRADMAGTPGGNDISLVVRVRCGGRAVLLTGDIGEGPQQWLIDHADVSADVLVLPHHGAVVGNTAAFIRKVGASHLVRSSFVRDADSPELLKLAGERRIYNTADVGAVEIVLGPNDVRVTGFAEP